MLEIFPQSIYYLYPLPRLPILFNGYKIVYYNIYLGLNYILFDHSFSSVICYIINKAVVNILVPVTWPTFPGINKDIGIAESKH